MPCLMNYEISRRETCVGQLMKRYVPARPVSGQRWSADVDPNRLPQYASASSPSSTWMATGDLGDNVSVSDDAASLASCSSRRADQQVASSTKDKVVDRAAFRSHNLNREAKPSRIMLIRDRIGFRKSKSTNITTIQPVYGGSTRTNADVIHTGLGPITTPAEQAEPSHMWLGRCLERSIDHQHEMSKLLVELALTAVNNNNGNRSDATFQWVFSPVTPETNQPADAPDPGTISVGSIPSTEPAYQPDKNCHGRTKAPAGPPVRQ